MPLWINNSRPLNLLPYIEWIESIKAIVPISIHPATKQNSSSQQHGWFSFPILPTPEKEEAQENPPIRGFPGNTGKTEPGYDRNCHGEKSGFSSVMYYYEYENCSLFLECMHGVHLSLTPRHGETEEKVRLTKIWSGMEWSKKSKSWQALLTTKCVLLVKSIQCQSRHRLKNSTST